MKLMIVAVMFCSSIAFAGGNADGLATDKDFKIATDGSTLKVKAGAQGKLVLAVVGINGFKVSQETPFSAKLAPSAGLKLEMQQFARKDLVDPKALTPQLKTGFTASAKGPQTVKADLVFFLCTDKLCQRMTSSYDVAVTVE